MGNKYLAQFFFSHPINVGMWQFVVNSVTLNNKYSLLNQMYVSAHALSCSVVSDSLRLHRL